MRAATQPWEFDQAELMLMHNTPTCYFPADPKTSKFKTECVVSKMDETAEMLTDDVNDV